MTPGLLDFAELLEASLDDEALPEADSLLETEALLSLEPLDAEALLPSEPLGEEPELLPHAVSARARTTAAMAAIEVNFVAFETAFTSPSFLTWARARTRL